MPIAIEILVFVGKAILILETKKELIGLPVAKADFLTEEN